MLWPIPGEEVVVQLEQDEGRGWQGYRVGRGVWNICGVSKVEMGSTKATGQVLKPQKLQGSLRKLSVKIICSLLSEVGAQTTIALQYVKKTSPLSGIRSSQTFV